jgi:nickel-type superoxide dismutase maturation protease
MGFGLFKVTGDSMLPNYRSGDFVLTFRRRRQAIKPGDVVVVDHPRFGRIIKRISAIPQPDTFTLSGDNHLASTHSEKLGEVSIDQLQGKVVWCFSR